MAIEELIGRRDMPAIARELQRALRNVEADPATAVTAACSVLEAFFKHYIAREGLQLPADQSILPLWRVVRGDLELTPERLTNDDLKRSGQGIASIAGFVAANAALALREVNYVLIPESDFDLEPPLGLLACLEERLRHRGHAVILVAKGAGQKYFRPEDLPRDPSGNLKPGDIGLFLANQIREHFCALNVGINLKYIDPSYIIRSMPANYNDRIYCGFLGQNAVHAGLAGKTAMLISRWHGHYVHVPIKAAVGRSKEVDLDSPLWRSVLESTGQPPLKNVCTL